MFVGLCSQRFSLVQVGNLLCCITLVYHHLMGFEALEKLRQLGTRKLPLERARLSVREGFVEVQPLFDLFKTGKVIGCQHFALHDREVDFHLIEPTGMDRGMHDNEIGVGRGQSADSRLAPVRRAIIHHPKDTLCCLVGLLFHHLRDQAPERLNARRRFTPAHDNAPPDIPGCQVLQRPPSGVLVLDPQRAPGSWWQARMAPNARLNTRLFIGADDVILGTKWFPLPGPGVQIQYLPSFVGKLRISGKNLVFVLPGFDGIGIENAPDRAGTDGLAQGPTRLHSEVCRREPTQRQASIVDRLTRTGFHEGTVQRGKTGPSGLDQVHLPNRTPPGPSVAANTAQRWDGGAPLPPHGHWTGRGQHARATPRWRVVVADRRLSVAAQYSGLAPQSHRENPADRLARDLA